MGEAFQHHLCKCELSAWLRFLWWRNANSDAEDVLRLHPEEQQDAQNSFLSFSLCHQGNF